MSATFKSKLDFVIIIIFKEDTHQIPDLLQFLNSLEFCNAVTQAAHPTVKQKLLEFVYHGFLVPVIGPALHQVSFLDYMSNQMQHLEIYFATDGMFLFLRSRLVSITSVCKENWCVRV